MFLSKEEKVLVLLCRIEQERFKTLLGFYKSYQVGENKIRKIKRKIEKFNGNPNAKVKIEDK